jgi:hypothetical protein
MRSTGRCATIAETRPRTAGVCVRVFVQGHRRVLAEKVQRVGGLLGFLALAASVWWARTLRPGGQPTLLLCDGRAAVALRTRLWCGLCFLPLLLILLMFAPLPLTAPWLSTLPAAAVTENNLPLAGLLALLLLALLALELTTRRRHFRLPSRPCLLPADRPLPADLHPGAVVRLLVRSRGRRRPASHRAAPPGGDRHR